MTGRIPLGMAWQIADIMVRTGRMVHPARWVDSVKEQLDDEAWDAAAPG